MRTHSANTSHTRFNTRTCKHIQTCIHNHTPGVPSIYQPYPPSKHNTEGYVCVVCVSGVPIWQYQISTTKHRYTSLTHLASTNAEGYVCVVCVSGVPIWQYQISTTNLIPTLPVSSKHDHGGLCICVCAWSVCAWSVCAWSVRGGTNLALPNWYFQTCTNLTHLASTNAEGRVAWP